MRRHVDLRLVPAGLAAWLAAAVTGGWTTGGLRRLVLATALLAALAGASLLCGGGPRTSWRAVTAQLLVVLLVTCAVGGSVLDRAGRDVLTVLARYGSTSTLDGTRVDALLVVASDPEPLRTPWRRAGPSAAPRSVAEGWTANASLTSVVLGRSAAEDRSGRVPVGGVARLRVAHPERTVDLVGPPQTAASHEHAAAAGSATVVPRWRSTVHVVGTMRLQGSPTSGQGSEVVVASTGQVVTIAVERLEIVAPPPWWSGWSDTVRRAARSASEGLSPQGRGLVPGIAIGDTTELPEDVSADMKTSAMTHMTAVSGSHFAILGALAWSLLGWLRLPLRARAAGLVVVIAALVVLVRPEPSVVRAAVMASVGVLAVLLRRSASAVPALATSVVVLVLLQPPIAREPGFVLSVAATAGLVVLVPLLDARTAWAPRWLRAPFVVSLAAQLPCAPVVAMLTPQVSLWAVPANALAALAVAPVTLLGLGATLMELLWPAAGRVLAWCAATCTAWIAEVAHLAARLPGAALPWWSGAVGVATMAVLCACLVMLVVHGPDLRWWLRRRLPAHLRAAATASSARVRRRTRGTGAHRTRAHRTRAHRGRTCGTRAHGARADR